jgi:hypothetical protein
MLDECGEVLGVIVLPLEGLADLIEHLSKHANFVA